jgi:ABC-type multidrug transport system ATPase subunit
MTRKEMTIIVISHRMSTLTFCDDAVVLHRGQVLKTGPLSSTLEFYSAQAGNPDLGIEANVLPPDPFEADTLDPLTAS